MPGRIGFHMLGLMMAAGLLAGGLAMASPRPQSSQSQTTSPTPASDRRSGFGQPESITGTITMVNPDEGLLVVTEQGAGHSTDVSGATVTTQNPDGSTTATDTGVSAAPAPAPVKYHFRVTAHTLIRADGRSVRLSDLAGMQNRQVTVHFVPERNGNFAQGIEVGS